MLKINSIRFVAALMAVLTSFVAVRTHLSLPHPSIVIRCRASTG
jgi:hypothetical protein